MIDFRKFYNATFYDHEMSPVPITEASLELASIASYMVEYDFSEIPDIPLHELVTQLITELPDGFTFINTSPSIVNIAVKRICSRIRPDIKFIDPFGDIDKSWYDWALPTLLLNNPQSAHELFTAWKLTTKGIPCGLIGPIIAVTDLGVITKNTMEFNASTPNWQIVDTYKVISMRLLAEHCPELVHPNFTLLLSRAFLKLLDLETNWMIYRTSTINKFFPVNFALALEPMAPHDFKTIANQVDYPRYPGLITREHTDIYLPLRAML